MINDPRAKQKLDAFFEHWLELEERDLSKDAKLYPQFDARRSPTCATRSTSSSTRSSGARAPTTASCCSPTT